MRRAYAIAGLAVLAFAFCACESGDDGGTGPTPGEGGGAGVWFADKDTTVHKLSLAGASLLTVGGFA
jgi:hypothetical protein